MRICQSWKLGQVERERDSDYMCVICFTHTCEYINHEKSSNIARLPKVVTWQFQVFPRQQTGQNQQIVDLSLLRCVGQNCRTITCIYMAQRCKQNSPNQKRKSISNISGNFFGQPILCDGIKYNTNATRRRRQRSALSSNVKVNNSLCQILFCIKHTGTTS